MSSMTDSREFNPYLSKEGCLDLVVEVREVEIVPAEGRNLSLREILFDPGGRLSRWTYFKHSIASGLFWWLAIVFAMAVSGTGGAVAAILLFLIGAYSQIVLMVKRWHDLGEPGASVVLNFIPILNLQATIKIYLTKGLPGSNAYGPEEKGGRLQPDLSIETRA
jgi:uncharacterized membrane protein YhaH (DUF805 family)